MLLKTIKSQMNTLIPISKTKLLRWSDKEWKEKTMKDKELNNSSDREQWSKNHLVLMKEWELLLQPHHLLKCHSNLNVNKLVNLNHLKDKYLSHQKKSKKLKNLKTLLTSEVPTSLLQL